MIEELIKRVVYQYSDKNVDNLCFDYANIIKVIEILESFHKISGLKISVSKTKAV